MAPKSEICDWQLECSELKQRGAHLLKSGEWSDCSFLVASEPQAVVPAHKLILVMASPVFEAMFYGGMAAEGNKPIPILDVKPEAFKALLEYIYTDNININSVDIACELCYLAKKYMLPHLVKECIKYLWSKTNPKNACRVYEFARLHEEKVLMEKCLQIISLETKEVLKDSSFNDIDYDTMRAVFSLEHLNVDSEMDLFEAADRHAKAQLKQSMVLNVDSSPEAGDANPEPGPGSPEAGDAKPESGPGGPDARSEIRETIRSAIEQIRFLTLSPQQFAEGPAESPLLTESETLAVLMNISSSRSDVPLPRGFSTSREPRKQLIGDGPNVRLITLSKSFCYFIHEEFKSRNMIKLASSSSYFYCCLNGGRTSISWSKYATHNFAYCSKHNTERLDFEAICRAFKVDPFSEDVKNHENTRIAFDIYLNQIKLNSN
ncbi:BTB/POZ domain-containing protein 3-like [Choristoneura fumiferana]|uniref:BTB/POZ domain-containing protein 3-like n=1 Tax=Choristoneura fumiferana TaxID=7141 RepID=UPI003D159089